MGIGEWEMGREMRLGKMGGLFFQLIKLGSEFFIFAFLFHLILLLLDQGLRTDVVGLQQLRVVR